MATTSSAPQPAARDPHYKWVALSNTTLGMLAASINGSILLISLPAIFRGIGLKPLEPGNVNILLWSIMGYMVATSVLVVTFGRLGDSLGRARIYNLGFLIFTIAAIALSLMPDNGSFAAWYLITVRILQGVGGAMLMANSTAILTDAFPTEQRGLALGINTIAAIGGSFIGLLIGGLLADIDWRLVFWINVPFGVVGTAWAYWKLKDRAAPRHRPIDWAGNFTFGIGLILILIGITEGIQPYGSHAMAWTSPEVMSLIGVGLVLIVAFLVIESRVAFPMFDLALFRIRPFTAGNLASLFAAIGRGGLQFMLIIWLQGIWLPLHGYSFEETPLWAGIFMLPLTLGFLVATPVSGWLSDHHGARPFAVGGMLIGAASFAALMELPPDFSYPVFALLLFMNGLGSGLFIAPNSTAIMNSVPPAERGQAAGMRATTLNAGQVLSIGIFFSLMIVGLTEQLPASMEAALIAQNVPDAVARHVASAPAVASLFAAFLGYNPMGELLPPGMLATLPNAAEITGKTFFPHLLAGPFMHGLVFAFSFSMILNLLAAVASWLAGGKYVHEHHAALHVQGHVPRPAADAEASVAAR
ncbi:MFS transporter [Mesorhizobium sp. BR1-1-16]|uniref:MFS transporter n=1 Tax=Mesorhizobium sp. BR1-1-16 TaxID=2876653 RepID=UPI001CCE393C|nr:MFS transporter [Mesorhizobium sp. BR1-1-16]MBZ9937100.1 MFS transporter [Mesorhizobium sp. BR1-1-16]